MHGAEHSGPVCPAGSFCTWATSPLCLHVSQASNSRLTRFSPAQSPKGEKLGPTGRPHLPRTRTHLFEAPRAAMQPWQGSAGSGPAPGAPPASQTPLSPFPAPRSLLDTPQSMVGRVSQCLSGSRADVRVWRVPPLPASRCRPHTSPRCKAPSLPRFPSQITPSLPPTAPIERRSHCHRLSRPCCWNFGP